MEAPDRSTPRKWIRIRSYNCLPEGPIVSDFRISIFVFHFCHREVNGILNFRWKINLENGKFLSQNLEYYENPYQKIKSVTLKHTASDLHPSSTTTLAIVTFKCTQFGVRVQMEKSGKFLFSSFFIFHFWIKFSTYILIFQQIFQKTKNCIWITSTEVVRSVSDGW